MKRYRKEGEGKMVIVSKEDGEFVDADIAQELYETVAEIASLYTSDVVPSDDFCWDEVVNMCREAKKKADKES